METINNHRSMLNQLLLLKNQTDIVNDPFITRFMTGIHKLRPSSANGLSKISTLLLTQSEVQLSMPKEQRKDGVISILELTSLDDTYSQVCPVHHLTTYLMSTKERRKKHQSDSVFINNHGTPLYVN
ncbi:hypothetical protein ACTFIZ_002948 [Dictyostelium cf. discoideum]